MASRGLEPTRPTMRKLSIAIKSVVKLGGNWIFLNEVTYLNAYQLT
jgi:hypothetical protein